MLPVILGAGAVVGGLLLNKADSNNERADRMNAKAFNRMGEARRSLMVQAEKTQKSLTKLANRKKGIMLTSIKSFVELYEQIIKINLAEHGTDLEPVIASIAEDDLPSMKQMVTVSGMAMTDRELIVIMLFSFQHGGILGSILKDSEINMKVASMRKKQADVIASQSENEEAILRGVYEQAEAYSDLLAKMNLLLMKSIRHTKDIISANGNDRSRYTEADYKSLMTCINLAKSVKTIVDAPLFDEDGEISRAVREAMEIGERYL